MESVRYAFEIALDNLQLAGLCWSRYTSVVRLLEHMFKAPTEMVSSQLTCSEAHPIIHSQCHTICSYILSAGTNPYVSTTDWIQNYKEDSHFLCEECNQCLQCTYSFSRIPDLVVLEFEGKDVHIDSEVIRSFKVLLICYLLVTYCLTYITTCLIMRTRRRAISDGNKNNELQLPLFLFSHLFTHFLLCLSVHLFLIQTPIDLFIETCANPSPSPTTSINSHQPCSHAAPSTLNGEFRRIAWLQNCHVTCVSGCRQPSTRAGPQIIPPKGVTQSGQILGNFGHQGSSNPDKMRSNRGTPIVVIQTR